jgi:hypothetical protein
MLVFIRQYPSSILQKLSLFPTKEYKDIYVRPKSFIHLRLGKEPISLPVSVGFPACDNSIACARVFLYLRKLVTFCRYVILGHSRTKILGILHGDLGEILQASRA